MNVKEYIESGILEAYVLDALPETERKEVAANIAQYPELAEEVAAIERSMQLFAEATSEEPPAYMQDQIWKVLQADTDAGQLVQPVIEEHNDNHQVKEAPKVIPFTPQKQWNFSRAAIWIALGASLLGNFILLSNRGNMQQQQVAMQQQADSLQAEHQKMTVLAANLQKEKDMLADTAMQTIVMKTMQPGHPMAATVYWNKSKGEAYLAMKKLPMPPKGMQYQMWVMQSGKPVSMGVLSNDLVSGEVSRIPMQVTNGQAFAISLEKEGGSPTPTMENIYVLGKTS